MPITNTQKSFGNVTKFFHWTISLLFFFQFGMPDLVGKSEVLEEVGEYV